MRRLKHNFKKGMAFVLSLAMVAGLVPAMSGGANTVQANRFRNRTKRDSICYEGPVNDRIYPGC